MTSKSRDTVPRQPNIPVHFSSQKIINETEYLLIAGHSHEKSAFFSKACVILKCRLHEALVTFKAAILRGIK